MAWGNNAPSLMGHIIRHPNHLSAGTFRWLDLEAWRARQHIIHHRALQHDPLRHSRRGLAAAPYEQAFIRMLQQRDPTITAETWRERALDRDGWRALLRRRP